MVIFYELRVILVIEPSTPLKLKSFDTFKDRPSRHSYYGSGCFSLVHTALPPIPIPTVRWFSTLSIQVSVLSFFTIELISQKSLFHGRALAGERTQTPTTSAQFSTCSYIFHSVRCCSEEEVEQCVKEWSCSCTG